MGWKDGGGWLDLAWSGLDRRKGNKRESMSKSGEWDEGALTLRSIGVKLY
jgi:hypothetical protein